MQKHPPPWTAHDGYDGCDPGFFITDSDGYIVLADTEGTLTRETLDLIVRLRNDLADSQRRIVELQSDRLRLDDLLVKAYQRD